jgi:hypothetical protein
VWKTAPLESAPNDRSGSEGKNRQRQEQPQVLRLASLAQDDRFVVQDDRICCSE